MSLTDDNGWAGVGYNNPHVATPALDALAAGGLILTAHYAYKFCAPTRASFLTGRLPYKLAATRSNLNGGYIGAMPDGTHLSYAMLPKKLAAAGYYSVHIGKWHQGMYAPAYAPIARGFNHSLGFLEGGEDHNTSKAFGTHGEVDLSFGAPPAAWPTCEWSELAGVALQSFYDPASTDIDAYAPWPARFDDESGCRALCENRIDCAGYSWRANDTTHQHWHKCFLVSKDGGAHPSAAAFRSATCARPRTNTTWAARGLNGTYTGETFAAEAVRVIEAHDPAVPLFMYLALHNTHAPLEAPWPYVAPFAAQYPDDVKRRATFCGMLSYVDATVANVTAALRRRQMWANTLFVWTNDNGSPIFVGGSNHPLRGGKGSNWEGGTRVPAFVTGGVLPAAMAGKTSNGLIHICDWSATFLELAGLPPDAGEPHAVAPSDSISAWPWLSGRAATSARAELVYDHNMFELAQGAAKPCLVLNYSGEARCARGALQRDGWKLVVGPEAQASWFGWFSPNASNPVNRSSPSVTAQACFPDAPCLFNLNASMTEHGDVSAAHPDVVAALLRRFRELAGQYVKLAFEFQPGRHHSSPRAFARFAVLDGRPAIGADAQVKYPAGAPGGPRSLQPFQHRHRGSVARGLGRRRARGEERDAL